MIELKDVTKKFGAVTALDHLSLSVKPGEILGIVGPDGAGKTTLIRLMTGVMANFTGHLSVLGTKDVESVKTRMGYVPQKFSLYRDLTVLENIDLIGALYGADRKTVRAVAEEILTFTGLWTFKDRLTGHLSGGMKQKLALAAGLLHKPDLFFLDEPTTGVDPVARREFWQLLYSLNKDGMTIVVATPYMDEAELCHRVAFVHQGRMIDCKSPGELTAACPYAILSVISAPKNLAALLEGCYFADLHSFGSKYHIATDDKERTMREINARLTEKNLTNFEFEEIAPSLEDVFVTFSLKGGINA